MYCKCGCRKITSLSGRNRKKIGHIKGEYVDYISGHNTKEMWNKGIYNRRGQSWKDNISKSTKGRTPWNKGKKWSEEVMCKLKGPRDSILGENNPNWKGGIDKEIRGIRRSREYRRFKLFIRQRDKVCLLCYSDKNLHVDHIKSFTFFPDLRYDPNNARLLCFECHKGTPNFGRKARKDNF